LHCLNLSMQIAKSKEIEIKMTVFLILVPISQFPYKDQHKTRV